MGYAADYRREQMQQIDDKIAELEREKYPLYRRELKNDENIRSLRRMLIKKRKSPSGGGFELAASSAQAIQSGRRGSCVADKKGKGEDF